MPGNPFYHTPYWRSLREQRLKMDGYTCTVPGCHHPANIVEHTVTRGPSPEPCAADRIDMLRSFCRLHDNQIKERYAGRPERKSGGILTVPGCDARGIPIDPRHRWRRA